MLAGIIAIASMMWAIRDVQLRLATALLMLVVALPTTVYPDWGHGVHPSLGIRPARFGAKYVDVEVPPLPQGSIVLIATMQPAAYFIPFAEPTARYIGLEDNMLTATQDNLFVREARRLLTTPGPAKFMLALDEFAGADPTNLLASFGLKRAASPCLPIHSNLEEQRLSLCPLIERTP